MKRQIIALVAGAALIAAPLMTNIATADNGPGGKRGERIERMAQKLNLTETQKAQLKTLHEQTKARMKAVLTPEQRAQMEAARAERQTAKQNGERPKGKRPGGKQGMFQKLNLSETQKTQMKQIRQDAKAARDKIFSPEQKAQLEQMKQSRQSRREQRRNSQ